MSVTVSDAEREALVTGYAAYLNTLADHLETSRPEWTAATAVTAAYEITRGAIERALDEAAGKVRAERGLPDPDPAPVQDDEEHLSHHDRGRKEGDRVLIFHAGDPTPPDLEDLSYLLADLMHWAGGERFCVALDEGSIQYQAECEEDAANAEEAELAEAFAGEEPGEPRMQEARLRSLMSHRPVRFDA